ncbi:hypothetical protein L226DRAFT_561297 [Lentinus tigrinus ALCF2SS1-7]|uniref:uncharacterized protein n=1 Tax=Lentinus tigrinus ALCF2SS1-7 TaxID=1328758 RepID=UPI001165D1E4|nr:hypothetical protein L226DRAFT_561297 [Lentinus tigrinus ALCF2SS1-7]
MAMKTRVMFAPQAYQVQRITRSRVSGEDDMEYRAYEAVEPLPAFDSYLTAEDRNHLAFLAPEKVEEWTRAKIDELLNRVRSLYSVSNAAAFINRKLPPEVLMEVFSHLKPSFERPGQLNILHVCRMWRHLLLRSTAFWGWTSSTATSNEKACLSWSVSTYLIPTEAPAHPVTASGSIEHSSPASAPSGIPSRLWTWLPLMASSYSSLSSDADTLELDRITESLILRTTDDRTIFLPSLRLLRIYHNHASMLLTSLIIPNSCTVKLSNPYPDRNGSIRDLLPHDLSAFHQIAAAERVCARVVAHSPRQSLQIFEAYTDGVKRFSLHFAAMDSGRYIPAEFRLLLHSMPCVRAIEFQEDARSMAVALGNVTSGRCVCPQLDELDVQWLYWYDTGFKALKTDNEELPPILPEHNSTFRKWIQSARAHGPTVLATFCDYIRRMLLNRAAAGSHLKKLHVRIDRQAVLDVYVDKESWEPSVLRERMLARLGSDFEGDLMVSFDEDM